MSSRAPRVCILAGEESGDLYGAELAHSIRARVPEAVLEGMGGHQMEAAGVSLLVDATDLASVGLIEANNKVAGFLRSYRTMASQLASTPYDAVVCIDCPELNLRLARSASRRGRRVVYFVTPQLWAWRAWRSRLLSRFVERCLVVLPFEVEFLRARGVEAEFVGHPLVDLVKPAPDPVGFAREVGLDPSRPIVGLLPGSRRVEVRYLLPVLRGAAERLAGERPDLQFVLPVAPTVARGQLDHYLAGHSLPLTLLDGRAQEVMSVADLCLITSGTATLEAALLGTPMIILYAGSYPSWLVVKLLSSLTHYGLPNLVAGRPVVPEFIQRRATPEAVAREALAILEDPARKQTMAAELGKVRGLLGDGGATERAAERILAIAAER